jgi:thiamine-phosphate pyrophosphorylase
MSSPYAWFNSAHEERMARFRNAGLYLVTSESLSEGRSTLEIVDAALAGGVRLIQLREKGLSIRELTQLAREVRARTREVDALLIVNDRLDVALAVEADGVHLGQDDLPIADARLLAPELIIGASSHDEAEAEEAEAAGASTVNIGPLFPTQTKNWTGEYLGVEGLQRIAPVLNVPFTVMGGIKAAHIPELCAAGARTIALVTAVTAAPDPAQAARELLAAVRRERKE